MEDAQKETQRFNSLESNLSFSADSWHASLTSVMSFKIREVLLVCGLAPLLGGAGEFCVK